MELSKIFSEVIGIIDFLGEDYKNQIPTKLYDWLNKNKSNYYNPQYDKNIPLAKQNICKDSISFLYTLHFNYWLDNNSTEKEQLLSILSGKV